MKKHCHMNHDRRHHHEWMEDGSLGGVLGRCGHYYTHRVGGGKRSRGNVMALIQQKPGITQKELSEELGVQPASISELLMKLERKGFVLREKDERDRRSVKVRLTEEGRNALKHREEEKVDPFRTLSAGEQETLKGLLEKLLTDWERRYPVERCRKGRKPHGCCEAREQAEP